MWFAKASDGFRAWFSIKTSSGTLRTGALPANFTVTVVDSSDSNSTSASVTESSQKPGLYYFTISSGFLVFYGSGDYGVVVEVNVPSPNRVTDVFSSVLTVSQEDIDSLAVDVALIPTNTLALPIDGGVTHQDALKRLNSWAAGKLEIQNSNEIVYFAEDGITPIIRNRKEAAQRTPLNP